MSPLARQSRSGATLSCSQANIVPVRPKPGRHLVADQQHAVAVAELAHRAQVAGRVDEDARRALDQRLDDHRRDLLLVGGEDARQVGGVAGLGGSGCSKSSGR